MKNNNILAQIKANSRDIELIKNQNNSKIDDSKISKNTCWSSEKIDDFFMDNTNTVWRSYTTFAQPEIISSTREGFLRDFCILGKTTGVAHLGELYVDESGEPILDAFGQEQYKIKIKSSNFSRLYTNEEVVEKYNTMGYLNVRAELTEDGLFKVVNNGGYYDPPKVFRGKPNTVYTSIKSPVKARYYYHGISIIADTNDYLVFRTDETGEFGHLISTEKGTVFDYRIYEGEVRDIKTLKEKEEELTILLPAQLMGAEGGQDKLFWDESKKRYIIERTNSSQTLETNITELIRVKSYLNKTYFSVESGGASFKVAYQPAQAIDENFIRLDSQVSRLTDMDNMTMIAIDEIYSIVNSLAERIENLDKLKNI